MEKFRRPEGANLDWLMMSREEKAVAFKALQSITLTDEQIEGDQEATDFFYDMMGILSSYSVLGDPNTWGWKKSGDLWKIENFQRDTAEELRQAEEAKRTMESEMAAKTAPESEMSFQSSPM